MARSGQHGVAPTVQRWFLDERTVITGATDLFHKNLKYLDDLSNDFQLHIKSCERRGSFPHQPIVFNQCLPFLKLSVDDNSSKRGTVTELLARSSCHVCYDNYFISVYVFQPLLPNANIG